MLLPPRILYNGDKSLAVFRTFIIVVTVSLLLISLGRNWT